MSNAPKRPTATMADLARERDAGRAVELVDGVLSEKPAPTPEHGDAQVGLIGAILPYRGKGGPKGPGGWWIMTEVEVLYEAERDVYRHDAIGFRRESHPERPAGMPVKVRPDWVCEILSTSTARNDTVRKQRTLHRHRVPHYWLLDPERETLTVLRWEEHAYAVVLTADVDDRTVRAEPFEGIDISLRELFGKD